MVLGGWVRRKKKIQGAVRRIKIGQLERVTLHASDDGARRREVGFWKKRKIWKIQIGGEWSKEAS